MEDTKIHLLNNNWTLWFHDPDSKNWSKESYIKIYTFNTIEGFWSIFNQIPKINIHSGMFFLMKENIFPLWEDEQNNKGGYWSYKVSKKESPDAFLDLLKTIITEKCCLNKPEIINGASISPKKGFCIIKIWNNDNQYSDPNILSLSINKLNISQTVYKSYT